MSSNRGGSQPDLYRLLGVPREASHEDIVQAWRRRARAEHPDVRPFDAAAAGRFRAVAHAYQVLGDPLRRAAYDRASGYGPRRSPTPAVPIPVRRVTGPAEPPLRAGPVFVERPDQDPGTPGTPDPVIRIAALAELALRYLAGEPGRPW